MATLRELASKAVSFIANGGRALADNLTGTSSKPLWPPPSELPRLARYARDAAVYEGKHKDVFVRYEITDKGAKNKITDDERITLANDAEPFYFNAAQDRPYITMNLCSRVSELLAARSFAEGVTVQTPEGKDRAAEVIATVSARNNLRALHILAGVRASWGADAFYEVYYDAGEQRLGVTLVDPAKCFPEVHPLDQARAVAWNIDQVLAGASKDEFYLWRKRHELRAGMGWVVNKLYRLAKDGKGFHVDFASDEVDLAAHPTTALLTDQAEKNTGVKGLLLIHVPNRPNSLSLWGKGDYSYDLLGLQAEINNRATQRADVLDKFVHPRMAGPFAIDPDTGVVSAHDNVFITQEGISAPTILTWDAQLTAVENAIKECKQAFATAAGVDVSSLTPREIGGPTSGRALRIEQMNTQGAAQQKQADFEGPLKQLYAVITQLAAQEYVQIAGLERNTEPLTADDITLQFGDGLPTMSIEDAEEQDLLFKGGLTTRARALKIVHGLSDDEAEKLAAEIVAEERAGLPAAPAVSVTSPFAAVTPGV